MSALSSNYVRHFSAETDLAARKASAALRRFHLFGRVSDLVVFDRAAEQQQIAAHREDVARKHAEKL